MIKDPCAFFRELEENPSTKFRLKVSEFLLLREHLYNCDVCSNRRERVLAKAPKIGFKNEVSEN